MDTSLITSFAAVTIGLTAFALAHFENWTGGTRLAAMAVFDRLDCGVGDHDRVLVLVATAAAVRPSNAAFALLPAGQQARMLACWRAGVLACWRAGVLACWRAGVLACWRAGVLACWRAGVLACLVADLLAPDRLTAGSGNSPFRVPDVAFAPVALLG
ncbi:hypothetical protein [Sphingomonas lacusdianchii]|uniref:hypothetical protein n=1 Tax=Sphingomonas lacusdianchii TaxID=2917992 RepID=UPI001F575C82|nr:hypothetical protein [Sphingomonas sp. JXJ CY 53]